MLTKRFSRCRYVTEKRPPEPFSFTSLALRLVIDRREEELRKEAMLQARRLPKGGKA